VRACVHTHVASYVCVRARARARTYVRVCVRVCARVCLRTHAPAYLIPSSTINAIPCARTCTHAHVRARACMRSRPAACRAPAHPPVLPPHPYSTLYRSTRARMLQARTLSCARCACARGGMRGDPLFARLWWVHIRRTHACWRRRLRGGGLQGGVRQEGVGRGPACRSDGRSWPWIRRPPQSPDRSLLPTDTILHPCGWCSGACLRLRAVTRVVYP
jgi:hypothetical protein